MTSETSRVEAFSDGVFAIAITLLILDVRLPSDIEPGKLATALLKLWPSYLAFLTSFGTIGIMWMNHHRLFNLINSIDDGLIAMNTLLLLGVTWVPFPTEVLAQHLLGSDQYASAAFYSASYVIIAIMFNVLWRYAVKRKLVVHHANVSAISRQYYFGPLFYLIALLIGLKNATACLIFNLLLVVYFAVPPRFWQRD
jgi:TMEM175 potassium channel family protein